MRARLDDVTEVLLQRFVDQWVISSDPRTPFVFGNEPYSPDDEVTPWVRVWIRPAGGRQESLGPPGARRFDRPAFVIVDIRSKPGSGQGPGQALGEEVREIFEGVRVGPYDIRFDEVAIQDVGEVEDGRWYQHLAECRFSYGDVR